MKTKIILGLILILALSVSANYAQQEITLTTSAANTTSSKSTIDLPALNGNPNAIIFATPMGNTATLNPNPIGAWYYNNKWNIFNITHAAMPIGATFKVQYFVQPDANHFLHIITTGSSATVPRSYLDYPVLNNQPNAQFKIFQNHSAVYTRNPSEAKAEYEAGSGKWFIENVNGTALSRNTAYNIGISPGALGLNPNTYNPVGEATPKNPTPISPTPPTSTSAKPSVLVFNENSYGVIELSYGTNVKPIEGLDNQTFTITQKSRIVFNTTMAPSLLNESVAVRVWLEVSILNAANQIVGRAVGIAILTTKQALTVVALGIGILDTPGTYHTKVTLSRTPGGSDVMINHGLTWQVPDQQRPQMIIQIFPD